MGGIVDPGDALQDRYAAATRCFGCGPANPQGLQIKSRVEGDQMVCRWTPQPHHEAFPGVVNGGIIGTLFDCHLNWAAAHHLMTVRGTDTPPCTVTADYHVTLRRPTPSGSLLTLLARVVECDGRRAVVEGTLEADGVATAACRGTFVAVEEGHPAFHRW
jgi:acyl-coenzyme A thioesterase PaaI-like protein